MTAIPVDSRVLVTGARGFIGSNLVRELTRAGARVCATTRAVPPAASPLITWRQCNIAQPGAISALLAEVRPEFVFHLSSLADGRLDRSLVIPTLENETRASVNVLMAASEVGIRRLVMPASLEEPDAGDAPASPYAAAKAASHLYARMFFGLYGTPVVMARVFMGYGPGQPDWKLIPATAKRLLQGESPMIESPDRLVDWVYISDVVDGLVAAMWAPDIEGCVVDVGSGQLTSVREVVERLREVINPTVAPIYGHGKSRGNTAARRANLAETARLMGWAPRIGLDVGLSRVCESLKPAVIPECHS